MQIEIKIDEKCKEPKIIVMTDKMTDEVNAIIRLLMFHGDPSPKSNNC